MLYLVTESSTNIDKIIRISLDAINLNVEFLQIRNKDISKDDFISLCNIIIKNKKKTKIIINDHVELAHELGADGAHIGQSDMEQLLARKILGNKILGLSVENLNQAKLANNFDLDYIAVSPLFNTISKKDASPPCGLDTLSKIKKISKYPVYAIGGITEKNTKDVMQSGADAICVVSEIFAHENPKEKIMKLQKIIKGTI